MSDIVITSGDVQLRCRLLDTPTAQAVRSVLPIESQASTWGEEVYFSTPISVGQEADAREVMEPGDIAFWPVGDAIAIGYGRTPVSRGEEIRLASPSNVFARALGDVRIMASVEAGSTIRVTLAAEE